MNTTLKTILGFVAVVVIGLAAGYAGAIRYTSQNPVMVVSQDGQLVGATNYNRPISFDEGIQVDNQTVITGSGAVSSSAVTVTTLTVGGGTALTKFVCASASYNPPSVASSGNALTGLNVTTTVLQSAGTFIVGPGLVRFDKSTSTGKYLFDGYAHSTGSSTIVLSNWETSAIDFATGTLQFCQWQ